jgi:hypothetical protein
LALCTFTNWSGFYLFIFRLHQEKIEGYVAPVLMTKDLLMTFFPTKKIDKHFVKNQARNLENFEVLFYISGNQRLVNVIFSSEKKKDNERDII